MGDQLRLPLGVLVRSLFDLLSLLAAVKGLRNGNDGYNFLFGRLQALCRIGTDVLGMLLLLCLPILLVLRKTVFKESGLVARGCIRYCCRDIHHHIFFTNFRRQIFFILGYIR